MLSITEINFDELYDESVLMFDNLDNETLHQIIVEGIIPDELKEKALHVINRWSKVDPKKKIVEIENKLKQQGVGVEKLKNIAIKHARSAAQEIKGTKDPKKMASVIKKHYRAAESEVQQLTEVEKWGVSVLILVTVVIINQFMYNLLTFICVSFGLAPIVGLALTAIFVGPLVEETAKFISIKKKATGQYFTIFNIAEFSSYVARLTAAGFPLLAVVIARLLSVGLHGVTTWIQWKKRKEGEEKGELDDKTAKKGLKIAILIHTAWNFLASLSMF